MSVADGFVMTGFVMFFTSLGTVTWASVSESVFVKVLAGFTSLSTFASFMLAIWLNVV